MTKIASHGGIIRLVKNRIGIFSGSFDPVHEGHIEFALQAIKVAKLDYLYFLPDIEPRHKSDVTHVAHRLEMLKLAIRPHPSFRVLELPDKKFSIATTLPQLKAHFKDDELFFVCGSDVLAYMQSWPLIEGFLKSVGLIIGIRESQDPKKVKDALKSLPIEPRESFVFESPLPEMSSSQIRDDLGHTGLLASTAEYVDSNKLYRRIN